MKYLIIIFTVLLYLPASGQPFDSLNRKTEIEECTKDTYSIYEFQRVVDSMQMLIEELCDYPVIFPVKEPIRISSGFGWRIHPVYRIRKFHTGIDIPKTKGTPVYATGNGIVTRKGYCSGYGNFIEIQHAGGFRSFYAHLSRTIVNIGDSVSITQQIACVGNTGVATGSHLHYEIRKGKRFLNPTGWCGCLSDILNNKQKQYEFSKISLSTGRGNKIPCADSLFPLC
ncbi:M23 family metallopeptidase [Bacteroides sp.]|uniref:M23 family metallopeptidase n=1 Tax=Bacteroides sp. TaxID=29523 RepID=UPI0025BF69DD|nr:M23 family metallopeptidase [Bacteroides sp.]